MRLKGKHGWLLAALIWLGVALFDAIETVTSMRDQGMHHRWTALFFTVLMGWVPWVLVTPFIVRLGRAYPLAKPRAASGWLSHGAAIAGMTLITSAWSALLNVTLDPMLPDFKAGPFGRLFRMKVESMPLEALVLYSFVLTISTVLDSQARLAQHETERARLNEQLSKAQLEALQRQIEPHFLFNTLNAIAGLVRENRNDAAVSMIAGLSELLRRTLERSDAQRVPLGEEMEFLEKYLAIQKTRFADRLRVSVDVPRSLESAQVPSLLLQPIVENAVKHGIARRAQGGEIRVTAARNNGSLQLSVYNDGPALPPDWERTRPGIGMANMRTRLQTLYGSAFDLTMRNQAPGGVEVLVSVPFGEEIE